MIYDYNDDFVIGSLEPSELDSYEAQAIEEVEKLGVTDEHFKKRIVVARTYMLACRAQYEADGIGDKYKVYEKEYDRALKEQMLYANQGEGIHDGTTVWNVKVGRS